MKKGLLFILLLGTCLGTPRAQSVSQRIDSLLTDPLLSTSEVGISVYDLTEGKSLYRHQAEKLYRPASTQKVITSVTALAQLGSDYTLNTRLQSTGILMNDTLKGNLYVVGDFDPELMEADLDSLAEAVGQRGIRHIADTLAIDVSMMDSVYWGPGWSWDDAPYAFQPYLSPLMLNRGCVDITVSPTRKDSLPQVSLIPEGGYCRVDNRAVCHSPEAGKLIVTRDRTTDADCILVRGNADRTVTRSLSIRSSQAFFLHTFLDRLRRKGITVGQTAVAVCPDTADTTFVCRRPLLQVLKRALKKSDNLCTEAMFFHLAKQHGKSCHLGFEDGQTAVNEWMKDSLGCDPDSYRIADGSGVSLYNYVSPQLLLKYLKYAYARPEIFQPLYESLPIAGVDGTLQHRMKKTAAHRKVRAKTGSVSGISSLAGYARAANGHLLAFVIINQNVLRLREARAFQDKVCEAMVR